MKPNYKQLLKKYIDYIDAIHPDQRISDEEKMNQNYQILLEQYMKYIFQEYNTDYISEMGDVSLVHMLCNIPKYDKYFTKEEQEIYEKLSDYIDYFDH